MAAAVGGSLRGSRVAARNWRRLA
ncbi:MAG: hypothetical protein JWP52_1971, partial [Rhizobacter sp.]|nr:hypothetical protein [Rhizobacter sp.]